MNSIEDDYVAHLARLSAALTVLPDKPEETPDSTLRVLWLLAKGVATSVHGAREAGLSPLAEHERALLAELIRRRAAGEPLAHITGRQRFLGLEMLAGRGALIPRAETELLARAAIAAAEARIQTEGELLAIDVCTGSGNVAVAMASAVPGLRVLAADISADAVALACRNVALFGLQDRVQVQQGDLLAPFGGDAYRGRIAMITCNPPYISSRKVDSMPAEIAGHEPRLAFDGGALGVTIVQRLVREAPALLSPGGCLLFEVGQGQGRPVVDRMKRSGEYVDVRGISDAAGDVRVIHATMRA